MITPRNTVKALCHLIRPSHIHKLLMGLLHTRKAGEKTLLLNSLQLYDIFINISYALST